MRNRGLTSGLFRIVEKAPRPLARTEIEQWWTLGAHLQDVRPTRGETAAAAVGSRVRWDAGDSWQVAFWVAAEWRGRCQQAARGRGLGWAGPRRGGRLPRRLPT